MASEANTEQHIPGLFTPISNEIARMGLPVGLVFDVAGEEALTVTLDVDAGEGVPPEGFALVADGTMESTAELLKRARFEPETIGVSEGTTVLSEDAALIVVDPSPTQRSRPEYDGIGAVVLSDARFAARELANRAVECGRELGFVLAPDLPAEAGSPGAAPESADEPTARAERASHEADASEADASEADADAGTEAASSEPDSSGPRNTADSYLQTDTQQTNAFETDASEAHTGEDHLADAVGQAEQEHIQSADGAGDGTAEHDLQDHDLPERGYDPKATGAESGPSEDAEPAYLATTSTADDAGTGSDAGPPEEGSSDDEHLQGPAAVGDMPEGHAPRRVDDALDDTASESAAEEETASAAYTPQTQQRYSGSQQEPQPQATTAPSAADMPEERLPEATEQGQSPDEEQPPARDGESATTGPRARQGYAEQPPRATVAQTEDAQSAEGDSNGTTGIDGLYDAEVFGPLSDYVQRLHHIRDALEADAEDGRAMTPEQEKALVALQSMGAGRNFYRGLRALFNRPPDELDRIIADASEPIWSLITPTEAAGFIRSPFPGVIAIGNNKGGVGKTALCAELAASIVTTGVPDGHEDGIKVLLVEQNYANPDLRKRVKLPPGRPPGMVEYIEDLRAAEAADADLPDLSEYVSHVQGLQTDNLYLLPIAADEGEWRHNGKATTEDLDAVYEAAADAGFDVLVVDLQNGLPQAGNLTAETIGFWISVADVMYLVVGPSEAVQNGSEFLDGARALVEYYGSSCSLVPVFNEWRGERSSSKRWARGLAALGADRAIAPPEFIPSEFADEYEEDAASGRGHAYFHRIPADPAVPDFMLEKRQISLESRRFKEPFYLLATDALTRIKQNNAYYFEAEDNGDRTGDGAPADPTATDAGEEGGS